MEPQLDYNGVITNQPAVYNVPEIPGTSEGPVSVRCLTTSKEDCEFSGKMLVEAFRGKMVHATSERRLPDLIRGIGLDTAIQFPLYYQQTFVAEYHGRRAGVMGLKFQNTPAYQSNSNHYQNIGCCDFCGLCCLECVVGSEKVSYGEAYVDFIAVDDGFRGKGIGKVLLTRADYEAKKNGCRKIYLYVMSTNRAKHLYERVGYREENRTSGCCCSLWCATGEKTAIKMVKNL